MEPIRYRSRRPSPIGSSYSDSAAFISATIVLRGSAGKQILLEDPFGNPIELFEPVIPEAPSQDA
jgi:hypothetical protein